MRISDWSSDVCSSDLPGIIPVVRVGLCREALAIGGGERRGKRGGARHRRREFQGDGLDRVSARLRVDAAARHLRGEGGAHDIVETLVEAGGAGGNARLAAAAVERRGVRYECGSPV